MRSCLFLSWYGKNSTELGVRDLDSNSDSTSSSMCGLGQVDFWSLGLTLLKKYGDSDLYSGVVKIKWENGYEILPTSSPKSYLSFTVIHRFYKHYLSIQSEQQSCSVAICYLTYEETEAQRSEEIWPRLHS